MQDFERKVGLAMAWLMGTSVLLDCTETLLPASTPANEARHYLYNCSPERLSLSPVEMASAKCVCRARGPMNSSRSRAAVPNGYEASGTTCLFRVPSSALIRRVPGGHVPTAVGQHAFLVG